MNINKTLTTIIIKVKQRQRCWVIVDFISFTWPQLNIVLYNYVTVHLAFNYLTRPRQSYSWFYNLPI